MFVDSAIADIAVTMNAYKESYEESFSCISLSIQTTCSHLVNVGG